MRASVKVRKPTRAGKIGSRFDDYLHEEGMYAHTQAVAIKRVLAWQLAEEMKKQKLTKSAMARRMQTSRSQLDRLFDPENAEVQLDTLARAARAVSCELRFEIGSINGRVVLAQMRVHRSQCLRHSKVRREQAGRWN